MSCAPDYVGKPVVSACSKPLTTYSVSGCRPMKCIAPTAEAKKDYVVKETSLEKPTFGVSATCLKGGMAGEVVPCIFDGEPYTLKGCDEASCESPHRTQETGYTVHPACIRDRGACLSFYFRKAAKTEKIRAVAQTDETKVREGPALPILQGLCRLFRRIYGTWGGPPLHPARRSFHPHGLRAEDLQSSHRNREDGL